MSEQVVIGLNAVITAVTKEVPRFLAVKTAGTGLAMHVDALPFGPFDPERDRTLELGLRRWVREKTGIEIGYVEQLYTFGNRNRDPGERRGGPRVISVAYLALVREVPPSESGRSPVAGLVPALPLGGLARRASCRHRQPNRSGTAPLDPHLPDPGDAP